MKILIRVDASEMIGSGHVMRCITLANALQKTGLFVDFICRAHPGNLISYIEEQGFTVLSLPLNSSSKRVDSYSEWLGCTETEDAQACAAEIKEEYQLLVVDHYALGMVYTSLMRKYISQIMVIDDLANRVHDCDLLLDQNLFPSAQERYQNLLPSHTLSLIGPRFALLRDEFSDCEVLDIAERENLLVFYGGSDPHGLTLKTLEALRHLDYLNFKSDIVVGESFSDMAKLNTLVESMSNVTVHVQCRNVAQLMCQSKLMLGAGGATHWERCITGLPGLLVTVAENQLATTKYLDQLGAVKWLGNAEELSSKDIEEQLVNYFNSAKKLQAMSSVARELVPKGAGTAKVVEEIVKLTNFRV